MLAFVFGDASASDLAGEDTTGSTGNGRAAAAGGSRVVPSSVGNMSPPVLLAAAGVAVAAAVMWVAWCSRHSQHTQPFG